MSELIAQGVGYAVAVILLMLASGWYGWEIRTRLALKLAHFRISERDWAQYDEQLKQHASKILPLRAQLHEIHEERRSER